MQLISLHLTARLSIALLVLTAARALGQDNSHADGLAELPGIVFRLNADDQPAAWREHMSGRAPLVDGRKLEVVFDSSGLGRHAVQLQSDSQPLFRQSGESAAIEFDGLDDFLQSVEIGRRIESFTLFICAAPQSNAGGYRALWGAAELGRNDYVSGFNVDQSFFGSPRFSIFNVEGAGFGGALDLMASEFAFNSFHTLEIIAAENQVSVTVDGRPDVGKRIRQAQVLSWDLLTIGARVFSNEPRPPFVQGFAHAKIADVILFDRILSEAEALRVRKFFAEKQKRLGEAFPMDAEKHQPLKTIENPPAVQVLLPGFDVRELPVQLPNINNLLYRPDGRLVALAYNGDVWLLSDSDGDGLEESSQRIWDNRGRIQAPIGMDLTPLGYAHGKGLLVTSKGKCSLLLDTDGDDVLDQEKIVADGWAPIPHGVDALGAAFDPKDHSIVFGIGVRNFVNAYEIGDDGKSTFDLKSERGTLLRISPDLKTREVIATGIRFPVALRFNKAGDLFCTDQEGATWLPNGNPFDELLHIQKGHHYGFPPRHPKHLPNVIDEPSTYDFQPQHQSLCGLNFNLPVHGGPTFGPANWQGDALSAGYSRGKLYRTQLVNTPHGYIAKNTLWACLTKLTVDCCVSPRGDLLVATHGGGPDWGSGPNGEGTLYKISYRDPDAAQPVSISVTGPREIQIAFDRPLRAEETAELGRMESVQESDSAEAGDRFETVRPGYAVVQMQSVEPRRDVKVHSAQVMQDGRTIILNTDPIVSPQHISLTIPWPARKSHVEGSIEQHADLDLHTTLNGVQFKLLDDKSREMVGSVLPHLDPAVSRVFSVGSASQTALLDLLASPTISAQPRGIQSLEISTQVDLRNMLHPVVQPGSKLDYAPSRETVSLHLMSNRAFDAALDEQIVSSVRKQGTDEYTAQVTIEAAADRFHSLTLRFDSLSGNQPVQLDVAWNTAEDWTMRPIPLRRFYVPWTEAPGAANDASELLAVKPKELEGGSWGIGRQVFFSDKAQCSRCHKMHGVGGQIGPDLSNLIHRDYASVLRDIREPNYAINPDHLTFTAITSDGRTVTGAVRHRDSQLIFGDATGKETTIDRDDVDELNPSRLSIMPTGLHEQLGEEAMRHLLTYLLTPPPSMPRDIPGRPEPRSLVEIERVLIGATPATQPLKPLHVVLVSGPKDHGPGEHDYPAWSRTWGDLLEAAPSVKVTRVKDWPEPELFQTADAMVFYQQGTWNEQRARDIDAFLARGGGVSYIHFAVDGGTQAEDFAKRIGLAWQGGASAFRHGDLQLVFDSQHPIARNLNRVELHDESYWKLRGDPQNLNLLAAGREDNVLQPLIWVREQGRGRVFVSIPGHYSWSFDDPIFRIILLRGLAWSANESVDRFNDLVLPVCADQLIATDSRSRCRSVTDAWDSEDRVSQYLDTALQDIEHWYSQGVGAGSIPIQVRFRTKRQSKCSLFCITSTR
ncbi:MAG: ThuA domain-containing protein [Pirellulales bacterium]